MIKTNYHNLQIINKKYQDQTWVDVKKFHASVKRIKKHRFIKSVSLNVEESNNNLFNVEIEYVVIK